MKIINITTILLITAGFIITNSCENEDEPKFQKSERQLYEYTCKGNAEFASNSPTIVDDYIYIGTSMTRDGTVTTGNSFFKFSKTLQKIWEFPLGDFEVRGGAALDSYGNIYFVAGYCQLSPTANDEYTKLYSLDNNGNFRWGIVIDSINEPESRNVNPGISNPAISADDIIYVAGYDFYAFNVNGNLVWKYEIPTTFNQNHSTTSPIIDPSGNIYFVGRKSELISLDKNGNERWRALSGVNNDWLYNAWKSSPAFSVDYSKIYMPTLNKLFCVSASTGGTHWEFSPADMTGNFRAIPAVDDHDNIYIGTHGSYAEDSQQMLYAIKADGSGLLWENNIGADMYSSPALGDDRILYIGSEDYFSRNGYRRLHAINMATGENVWSASFNGDVVWCSPAISNDGILYIGSMWMDAGRNSKIMGFQTGCTGLLRNAGSPRFHGGNSNTGRKE